MAAGKSRNGLVFARRRSHGLVEGYHRNCKRKDPAARNSLEVLLTYPGVKALAAHRLSHWMWQNGFKLLARMHSQFWRFWTNIEIHPGAEIASGVFIDRSAGLVISGLQLSNLV